MNCSVLNTDDTDITISSTERTSGTTVLLSCNQFGHRLVGGESNITCYNGTWSFDILNSECQWSWDLNTHEKVVLGTSIAAGIFIILIIIVILIAYCCCYKQRLDDETNFDDAYENSSNGHVKNNNYDSYGPPLSEGRPASYPDMYYAYQEYPDNNNKNYGVDNPAVDLAGVNKPWMGYIPRPKIADRTYYNT